MAPGRLRTFEGVAQWGAGAQLGEVDVEERGQLALVSGGHQRGQARGQSAAGGDRTAVTMTVVRRRRSRMLAAAMPIFVTESHSTCG